MVSIIFIVLQLLSIASSFEIDVDCSKLQFWNREKRIETKPCNKTDFYHCAWNLFSNNYTDICWPKRILIRNGQRPTIQGGLHYGPCPEDRYQPYPVVSNNTVDCWFLKSPCNEEGQVICNTSSHEKDSTCLCDYTKGYAFVKEPRNRNYCIQSEEDCACYKKTCDNKNEFLSQDYECVSSHNDSLENEHCLPFVGSNDSVISKGGLLSSTDPSSTGDIEQSNRNVFGCIFLIAAVIALLTLSIISCCPFIIKPQSEKTNSAQEGEPAMIGFYIYGVPILHHEQWEFENKIIALDTAKYCSHMEEIHFLKHAITLTINDVDQSDDGRYRYTVSHYGNIFCSSLTKRTTCSSKGAISLIIKPSPCIRVQKTTNDEIKHHIEDLAYYKTEGVQIGVNILQHHNALFILGHEGTGKSKLCLELAKLIHEEEDFTIFKFSSIEMGNATECINPDKKQLHIYDINVTNDQGNQTIKDLVNTMNTYCARTNLKFMLTILTNYENKTLSVSDVDNRQQLLINQLSFEDKRGILGKHMKKNNIEVCEFSYLTNFNESSIISNYTETVKIWQKTVDDIVKTDTLLGFPRACSMFCTDRTLLQLEDRYFKNPPKSLIKDISSFRTNPDSKISYVVLVYTMIKGTLDLNNIDFEIMKSVSQHFRQDYKTFEIKDAAELLTAKFFEQENTTYRFCHKAISKAVWASYTDIDPENCLKICDWSNIDDLVRPLSWHSHETDVYIPVETRHLLPRLAEEIHQRRSWTVGLYLHKLSDYGKDLITDILTICMESRCKTDIMTLVPLDLFDGLTDFGKKYDVYLKAKVSNEFLKWPYLDKSGSSLFHYCVLHNYEKLISSFSNQQMENFLNLENKTGYTALHLAAYLGRKEIFSMDRIFDGFPRNKQYFKKLRNLSFEGAKLSREMISPPALNIVGQMVLRREETFGDKDDFKSIKTMLWELKNARKTI